ncbi:hypothetical protein OC846_002356 [Tilletia horrida]|uniref:Roadblock/LAMTOR2 domain-containing protein n=1 Tax=Tilletia horrida TaxID=155126 RepID=A0AAN6GSF3_9BASI|nr:hypothetical protein OC846_002356 [Tilletia horrida]
MVSQPPSPAFLRVPSRAGDRSPTRPILSVHTNEEANVSVSSERSTIFLDSPARHVVISPENYERRPRSMGHSTPRSASPMPPSAGLLADEEWSGSESERDIPDEASSVNEESLSVNDESYDTAGDDPDATLGTSDSLVITQNNPFELVPQIPLPYEVESTLSRITTTHRSVTGTLVLTRDECSIVRASGPAFNPTGPGSHERGSRLIRLVKMIKRIMAVVDEEVNNVDDEDVVDLLRVRSHGYEAIITPSQSQIRSAAAVSLQITQAPALS